MSTTHRSTAFQLPFFVLLLTALLVPALPSAADMVEETIISVEAGDAGDAEFEVSQMQDGDRETFTTDAGTPIHVTRTETGYLLELNGKEINVATEGHAGDMPLHTHAGEGEGKHVVVIKEREIVGDDGEHIVMHGGGEGEEKRVIKRITTDEDGKEKVEVRVLGDGEEIDLEDLAGEDGDVRVVKRVIEDGNGEKKVEVRVLKDGEEMDLDGEMDFHVEMDGEGDGDMDVMILEDKELEGADGDRIVVKVRKKVVKEEN